MIELTQKRLRELLRYNANTGEFTNRVARGGIKAGAVAGHTHRDGYVRISVDGRDYKAHRLAWIYVHGVPPVADIDHRDGNRGNNSIDNLRDVPRAVNTQNRHGARKDSTCGYLGVGRSGPKWRASIQLDGHKRYLGTFPSPELAHAAYLAAKRALHVGFVGQGSPATLAAQSPTLTACEGCGKTVVVAKE